MEEKDKNELIEKAEAFAREQEEKEIQTRNMSLTTADGQNASLTEYKEIENNQLVDALLDTTDALDMAKEQFKNIKNQKNIARKMENVAKEKVNADIESANLQVKDQQVSNKIKRAEQRNKLIQLNADKKYLEKEAKHRLKMQSFKQMKEKNYDLLLRYFRAKHKDENGKWVYETDAQGNPTIHMPSRFSLMLVRFFDTLTNTLNQVADAVGGLNKVVFKMLFIILLAIVLFVPPVREWLLGLIGIGK